MNSIVILVELGWEKSHNYSLMFVKMVKANVWQVSVKVPKALLLEAAHLFSLRFPEKKSWTSKVIFRLLMQ